MSTKLLFISNIIGKGIGSFSAASIKAAKELGYEYHMAANFNNSSPERMKEDEENFGITIHHIDFVRQPYDLRNIKAYRQVTNLINEEYFDIIHCNTPIGGVIGRLAGRKCRVKKIIYQVHGFHFYSGAPMRNWLIYYPIEKWLAHYTDALITINSEDYSRAQKKFHLKNYGKVYYVPGVGIDLSKFSDSELKSRDQIRNELALKEEDFVCISAGDLVPRKNYEVAIRAVSLVEGNRIQYLICGLGPEKEKLEKLAKELGVERNVHFLGYRTDILDLYRASDFFLFTSFQEGLPRSTMEAMASGLPIICSNIRGNNDLVAEGINGYLCNPNSPSEFSEAMHKIYADSELKDRMSKRNMEDINKFSLDSVSNEIKKIYASYG